MRPDRALHLTERGDRAAGSATRGRRAAAAACAAATVILVGIFATPALASDGTSTPTAANGTEVSSDGAEVPSDTAEAANPASGGESNGPPDDVHATDLTQSVDATAEADQDATNTSIVVRNDASGNDGPVSQVNTADATATGSANGTTPGNAGVSDAPSSSSHVSQDVQAGAIATQSGVANTNISVRVGSAGDSGTVSQANTATATAAASASDPTAATQAASEARQDGATNANVSVRVFSPGNDGEVTQANTASACSTAVDATAQAQQTDVRNTNVSIRIESPGSEAGATQGSSSVTATDGCESAETPAKIFVENQDGNTDVRIRVNNPDLADPTDSSGGLVTVWVWTWQWEYDEGSGLPPDLDQADPGWNWDWTGEGVSVTSVPLTSDLPVGSFVWSWDWERDGEPTWTSDMSAPLSCNCIWIWNWTWTWKGSSVDANGTAPTAPATTSTAVEQQNNATAVAEASVLADVSQASASTHDDDDFGTSFAGQLVDLTQLASADASAVQSDTHNELWAPGRQANVARADAVALGAAFVTQDLVQARVGGKETSQWAGQQVLLGQHPVAQAAVSQNDAQNVGSSQTTLAAADAEALALAEISQQLDQRGRSLGGTQDQWAGQLTNVVQMAEAVTLVDQSGARGGASALASTSAAAEAVTIQGAEQKAIGRFGIRSQRSAQLADVNQLGTSTATTADSTSEHANREASSNAITQNAGRVEQRSAQESTEGGATSIQDSTQQTLLAQAAHASSPSLGGKAGTAAVVNYATVGQASRQGMDGPVVVGTADHAYVAYVSVDRGARPMLSRARGLAPRLSLTAGGPPAPPLGAFAPVARTPQVSAAIVSAPRSGHDGKAAVRDHTEQPLQWPCGLPEVGSASSIVPVGGGGMAAAIAALFPAVLTGWRVVAGSVVRRPTHFALRLERPG
jgi:hypothetical protein